MTEPITIAFEPEFRQIEPVADKHAYADKQQGWAKRHFTVFANEFLYPEQTGTALQHNKQYDIQCSICDRTPKCIKQPIEKSTLSIFDVFSDKSRLPRYSSLAIWKSADQAKKQSKRVSSRGPITIATIPCGYSFHAFVIL